MLFSSLSKIPWFNLESVLVPEVASIKPPKSPIMILPRLYKRSVIFGIFIALPLLFLQAQSGDFQTIHIVVGPLHNPSNYCRFHFSSPTKKMICFLGLNHIPIFSFTFSRHPNEDVPFWHHHQTHKMGFLWCIDTLKTLGPQDGILLFTFHASARSHNSSWLHLAPLGTWPQAPPQPIASFTPTI